METKYSGLWTDKSDLNNDYPEAKELTEEQIVYAGYTDEDCSGDAIVVFMRDGKLYENHDEHCSCNGLENWTPEETTKEAMLMRKWEIDNWPGLRSILEAL